MVILEDKLLQIILNEQERIKDSTASGVSIGAGDYLRLLQLISELQKSLEQQKKHKKILNRL